MAVENLLCSISDKYLHFNRVDSYKDFLWADQHNGKQLPKDQPGNATVNFLKAPDFSVADYYDGCRGRTYACCFSLENSDFIWKNYANNSKKSKVCIVFEFGKRRARLNQTLQRGNSLLFYKDAPCHQIFSIN